MATILIGWESGSGLGHVTRLKPVARALVERGHRVVMLLREVVETGRVLKDEPYPVLQAPYWSRPAPPDSRGRGFSAATFSDILAVGGFRDPDELSAMQRAWDGVFEVVRPDLILSEYAPHLVLAARGRVPTILYGNGFVTPPADLPVYPRLQPNVEPVATQNAILAVVAEVQKRRGAPVPATLPGVFACERRFPCVLPELDPYRAVRREPVLPPPTDLLSPLPPPAAPRFFGYLTPGANGVQNLLSALAKSGVPGSVYLASPPQQLKDWIATTAIALHAEPQPMAEALANASFVVHHASLGTAEACLSAGRPQLLLGRDLEKALIARSLGELGVGVTVYPNMKEDAIVAKIREIAGDAAMRERAAALSRDIAARGPGPGIAPIVTACDELLAKSAA